MQIFKEGVGQITLAGVTYKADESGIIDVPDSAMNSSVWTQGFVSAAGRLAELAKQPAALDPALPIATVAADPVVITPAADLVMAAPAGAVEKPGKSDSSSITKK